MMTEKLSTSSQNKNAEITIIRTVAVILVVFIQHSFAPYGHSWHFTVAPSEMLNIYGIMSSTFNNISMPLLIFISAYLYSSLYFQKGKYRNQIKLIINKVERLLIPAYTFGLIFMVTLAKNDWFNIFNGYNHLWYLSSLFNCFVLASFLIKFSGTKKQILLLFLSFIFIYIPLPQYFGLMGFHHYFFYFYMGVLFGKNKDALFSIFSKKSYLIILVLLLSVCYLFVILFDKNGYTEYPFFHGVPMGKYLIPLIRNAYRILAITAILLLVTHLVSTNKLNIGRYWSFLDKTSYGLYIFHMWFMWLAFTYFKEDVTGFANKHYIIFPFLFFATSAIASTIVTYLLQQTKIGRYLLG